MEYVISIGTNLGDRKENIQNCIESINLLPNSQVTAQSSIYETEPVGYAEQDNFYNIILKVKSALEPNEMLGACLGIEAGFGRIRKIRNGPRIIDVDLIFAEDRKINSKNLIVPHPRYSERRFVLEPLLELFPDGMIYGNNILPMIEKIDGQEIKKLI